MPASKDVDAILYVKQIPEIKFENGHFSVKYDVGERARFEFVFSPNTFLRMRREAGKVVDAFHERDTVKPVRRKNAESAH